MKYIHLLAFFFAFTCFNPLVAQKIKKNKDYIAIISTEFGEIHLVLYDDTPKHKQNFLKLASEGFYDESTFHRVMNNFMIQGGDPESKPGGNDKKIGMGGPGYTVSAELLPKYRHDKGALAAARQPDRINPEYSSSGSQFYIVQSEKGAHHLDKTYTIFGKVIKGIDVVDKIAEQPVGRGSRPIESIPMKVRLEWLKRKKIEKIYGYPSKT
ncbi:MAG: peptidylprolyl isomerase [Bacteroidota bacterium]